MAFGYARSTGRASAFSVVPGPGMLNAAAAMLTAQGGNEPVLLLTGQVPTAFLDRGRGHLHEMRDQLATLRSIVKWAERVESPAMSTVNGGARLPGDALRTGAAWRRSKCRGTSSRPARKSAEGAPARPAVTPAGRYRSGRARRASDQGRAASDDLRRQRRDPCARGGPGARRSDRCAGRRIPQRTWHRVERARARPDDGGGLRTLAHDRPHDRDRNAP